MAFILREPPDSMGWGGNATVLMALVIGAAGLGNTLGIVIGSWTKSRRPERVVLAVLVLDVVVLVVAAAFFKWPLAAVLGLTVGLCQSLGKLSLDALIQRDVGEEVRTSMFARSETLLQLSWVIGGLIGIGLFTARRVRAARHGRHRGDPARLALLRDGTGASTRRRRRHPIKP